MKARKRPRRPGERTAGEQRQSALQDAVDRALAAPGTYPIGVPDDGHGGAVINERTRPGMQAPGAEIDPTQPLRPIGSPVLESEIDVHDEGVYTQEGRKLLSHHDMAVATDAAQRVAPIGDWATPTARRLQDAYEHTATTADPGYREPRWPTHAAADPRELPDLRRCLLELTAPGSTWHRAERLRSYVDLQQALANGTPIDDVDEAVEVGDARALKTLTWYRQTLTAAQLIYVHPQLVDLVEQTMQTVPDDYELHIDALPSFEGLAVFGRPVFGTDAESAETIRLDAVMWGPSKLPPIDHDLTRPDDPDPAKWKPVHCVTIAAFREYAPNHTDRHATYLRERMNRPQTSTRWAPLGRSDWPLGARIGHMLRDPAGVDPDAVTAASMTEDRRLVAALWALIEQRRLVDRTPVHFDRPARRRLERAGVRELPSVSVVHLRRPDYVARDADPDAPERRVKVRFPVRPFWRQQPCGPGRSERRLTLVAGHWRGPVDGPIVHTERVWSLDR